MSEPRTVKIGGAEFLATAEGAAQIVSDNEIMRGYWKVQPGDVCLDIGFGPGTWTLVALAKGGRTISFDPKPDAVRMLMDQLIVNAFTRALVMPFGLWDRSGVLPFGANGFREDVMEERRPVETLDAVMSWLDPKRVDYINMDAEWSEREIVKGARFTIRRHHPKIIIELHDESYREEIVHELKELAPYHFMADGGFLLAKADGAW